jgi:coenzyme F420 hydrogenase subunit beta
MHPVWDPIRTLERGWSTDDDLRFRSAAGGAMTALGCYLLETDRVDAVLHVRASVERPMLTDAVVSRNADEVRAGAQSRYGPAAPLKHVHRLLDEGIRFAVLAKPCDVGAIRSLGLIDARVATQIPYLITIFCGGVPTVNTAKKIAAHHGVEPDEVAVFRWRGNGWPGPTHIETRDGRTFEQSYDYTWYTDGTPWTYDIQFRCKICPDAIGELADVSCPDAWVMDGDRPLHEEAPGANLFLTRTPAGEQLVRDAAADGAIEVHPFTVAELDAQHADHYPRKLEHPARVEALVEQEQLAPRFENFRKDKMIALAGPQRRARAKAGTVRRIKAGANREPVC